MSKTVKTSEKSKTLCNLSQSFSINKIRGLGLTTLIEIAINCLSTSLTLILVSKI